MGRTGDILKQLDLLATRLAATRESDRKRYGDFFTDLRRSIEAAQCMQRELDRQFACRFNALDYLRTDELGLSQVIADLLDPDGSHGQGSRFLALLGDLVGPDRWPADRTVRYDAYRVDVKPERWTDRGGRLDISVELQLPGHEPSCLAIENKPYSADGDAQIVDYLSFLRRRYRERFLLIYLPGHGGMPSQHALPGDACRDGLAIMPYCHREAADECEDTLQLHLPFSLADWLQGCQKICEAARVRWFLCEVERFCNKTFGGNEMTTGEQKAVRDFILESDDNVLTAIAVCEAWPKTKDDVIGRFLERLRDRVGAKLDAIDDLQTGCRYADSVSSWARPNGVWVFRNAWTSADRAFPLVCLTHDGDAKDWSVGVRLKNGAGGANAQEEDLKDRLRSGFDERLGRRGETDSESWPWYCYVEEHKDWNRLLARLHKEAQDPGELMEYFSHQLVEAADLVFPIIDEVLLADR